MALALLSLWGAALSLIGIAFGAGPIIGAGVLMFFAGLLFTVGTVSIPWYVWTAVVLVVILMIRGKK